jgi:hypothetical protein
VSNSKWVIEYENDVGDNDESFWEWWEVTDGKRTYKADSHSDAEHLCVLLNAIESFVLEVKCEST